MQIVNIQSLQTSVCGNSAVIHEKCSQTLFTLSGHGCVPIKLYFCKERGPDLISGFLSPELAERQPGAVQQESSRWVKAMCKEGQESVACEQMQETGVSGIKSHEIKVKNEQSGPCSSQQGVGSLSTSPTEREYKGFSGMLACSEVRCQGGLAYCL